VHHFVQDQDPIEALKRAVVFASYKIGNKGAADGFLDTQSLADLYEDVANHRPFLAQ